jgi:hypothetical protein
MECPCKGCNDREAGCHSRCSAYDEWHKDYEKVKSKIRKETELNLYFGDPRRYYSNQ